MMRITISITVPTDRLSGRKRVNRPRSKKRSGFTVVELLVVVTLIALLVGAGGGIYLGTYKRRLVEKSARELLLTAKYARVVAIERQKPCKLVFDREENRFWLTVENLDEQSNEMEEVIINDLYSKPVELQGEVKFEEVIIRPRGRAGREENDDEEKRSEIVFVPDGSADAALVTIGDGRSRYTLSLSAGTGKAKLQFGKQDEGWNEPIDLDE